MSFHQQPLVKIEATTTAVHAQTVLQDVVGEVTDRLIHLMGLQADCIEQKAFGAAVYHHEQIRKALEAAVSAQQLLEKLTTQGENEHGNDA